MFMNKISKSILIQIIGVVITLLSFSFLIRIIPHFGKLFLFVGLGVIFFGFFLLIFSIFEKNK